MSDELIAFGVTESEAERFAEIAATFHNRLRENIMGNKADAINITTAWVQATIEGVHRVTAENVKRVEAQKVASQPVDHLAGLRK